MRSDYENPWRRLPWTLGAALLAWLVLLWAFGKFLSRPEKQAPIEKPVDAKLIEIPPPPKPGKPKGVPAPAKSELPKPAARPRPSPQPKAVEPPSKPETEVPRAKEPEKAASESSDKGMPGGDVMGARAIYSPKPEIPDEYRRDEMDFQVVARFHIAADGTATVELIKATPIPGLNQAILNTLDTYKFFPALKDGKPVDSTQDWRFRFQVK